MRAVRRRSPALAIQGRSGLRRALLARFAYRWAYDHLEPGARRFKCPREQIIDNLVREWSGKYTPWNLFDDPVEGSEVNEIVLAGAWRLVRVGGTRWKQEMLDYASGQWKARDRSMGVFPEILLWPFQKISESQRAKNVRVAICDNLITQARERMGRKLRLTGPYGNVGQAVAHIRRADWGHDQRGILRNKRVEPAMRVFANALWKHVIPQPVMGGLVAVFGMGRGVRLNNLIPHLENPDRILGWAARANMRPLLADVNPSRWPRVDQPRTLVELALDRQDGNSIFSSARVQLEQGAGANNSSHGALIGAEQCQHMINAPAAILRKGTEFGFSYWSMSPMCLRKLDDLSVRDRCALVQWCNVAREASMPVELMEAMALHHRYTLLRLQDSQGTHTGARSAFDAQERIEPLVQAMRLLISSQGRRVGKPLRSKPPFVSGAVYGLDRKWPKPGKWIGQLAGKHPWAAQHTARSMRQKTIEPEQDTTHAPARRPRL